MKKLFFLGLVGCLVLGGIVFAKGKGELVTPEKQEANKSIIKVETKEIKVKNEELEIDFKIPVITGLSDSKVQDNINYTLEKSTIDFKNEMEKGAKEFIKEAKKEGWEIRPFTASSDYEVSYNKNGLISISVTSYQYTGGAHGLASKRNYTLEIELGKELSLKDLFKDDSNYKKVIDEEIKTQIEAKKDEYFDGDMGFQGISDAQSFYIKDGKLVIHFGLYEIAPYASGMKEFEIPFSSLKDIIKPQFSNI